MITTVKCDPLRFGTSIALIDGKKVNLAVAKMKAYFIDKQDRTHIRTHRHYFLKVRTRYSQTQTYQGVFSLLFVNCSTFSMLSYKSSSSTSSLTESSQTTVLVCMFIIILKSADMTLRK